MDIDPTRAYAEPTIPLAIAAERVGASVTDLFEAAARCEIRLLVSLRRYTADHVDAHGHAHPWIRQHSSGGGGDVELLPALSRELSRFDTAAITHFPSDDQDTAGGPWFWRLHAEQVASRADVRIADGHVGIGLPLRSGNVKKLTVAQEDEACDLLRQRVPIAAIAKRFGVDRNVLYRLFHRRNLTA